MSLDDVVDNGFEAERRERGRKASRSVGKAVLLSAEEVREIEGIPPEYVGRSLIEIMHALSQEPEYRKGNHPNITKIKDAINNLIHYGEEVRTANAIRHQLRKRREDRR